MDPISALAELVDQKLTKLKQQSPGEATIEDVLRVVYSTSMKKEESEPLRCSVAYMDPNTKNDGKNPNTDCWNAFPLAEPIQYDTRNLAKISRSADPGAIVIAVFPDSEGKLRIWGFIDQVAVHSLRLASWETWHAEGIPGIFHVSVNGVGDLTVLRGLGIIGALKQDTVVRKYDNVMDDGPVASHLYDIGSRLATPIAQQFADMKPEDLRTGLGVNLVASLSRILLHIQRYKHGGALLITGETSANLKIHHRLAYDRLPRALSILLTQLIRKEDANHVIYEHLLPEKEPVPAPAFLEFVSADIKSRYSMSEMAGCVRFIASLSRVDGLVLMGNDLKVHGFGTEIVDVPEIAKLHRAIDEQGQHLEEIDVTDFGTRHRSMFRYCNAHEDSLGFVVSQDGLIRAVKKVGDKLVMWENVQVISTINDDECVDGTCDHCRAMGFSPTETDEQLTDSD